jgi:hypothetical protein
MLRALFEGTDPGANLNPGKIVAGGSPLEAHQAVAARGPGESDA